MEGSAEHAGESSRGRWRALALWWATHALVGGVARVLFDVSLPAATQSARLAISSADVPLILQLKTVGGMLSKLAQWASSSSIISTTGTSVLKERTTIL